ncbi:unnamed protein product, partial [Didymodactylos carnosus]
EMENMNGKEKNINQQPKRPPNANMTRDYHFGVSTPPVKRLQSEPLTYVTSPNRPIFDDEDDTEGIFHEQPVLLDDETTNNIEAILFDDVKPKGLTTRYSYSSRRVMDNYPNDDF